MFPRPTLIALALTTALLTAPSSSRAGALERDWCTGLSPVSWGFSVTPTETCHEIRLRAVSTNVRLLSAEAGPGLPEGWTVSLVGDAEVVARGDSPVRAGQDLRTAFLVETNRSSSSIDRRGVRGIDWELSVADADGLESAAAPHRASFPPVMELSDALSRGLVLATVEPHGSSGPVEMTVDNPTWHPLWLDVPPGTVLTGPSGEDWVVGLTRPFRMMRKQRTGRTVAAFPLSPRFEQSTRARRLKLANRVHERAESISEIALAVVAVEQRSLDGERRPGAFEALEPFEFWPMVFRWAVWQETTEPGPELLEGLVRELLESRVAAGDRHAARLDASSAAAEIERARQETIALLDGNLEIGLSLRHRASRARFR
jgi:hypothetical protein